MILCHQCGSGLRDGDRFCAVCGAAVSNEEGQKDPLVGRTIDGSYMILDLVGVGGMGRVYRAEQRMLGRTVAIKVIHPHLLSDEQSVARFYNEARAASRLNHPNSVSIIDFGRTDDGILYLVMEYLQGRDLAQVVRDDGPLAFGRVCDIVGAVLDALGEAHVLGVVHRDLKPENVIIERLRTGNDLIKVVDFGLAKLLSGPAAESSITSPGLVCGTPDYMSPEQGRGFPVDERGDIYSMGVMLYELLSDALPFVADTPTNVVLRHIQDPVPDPRMAAPDRAIPDSLAEVVVKALQKSPDDRYQSAHEMAIALRAVSMELGSGTREVACSECGAHSPSGKRFCGECGAALRPSASPREPTGPRMSMPPRMTIASGEHSILIARDGELADIETRRAGHGFSSVCLAGEAGVGKTRLLAALAQRASEDGDLVVGAGPHDSGATVPYHPIHTMLISLLGVDDEGLAQHADELAERLPLAAAGMREVVAPVGLRGAHGGSRAGGVAAALAYALEQARDAMGAARTVLMIDDLQRCDGLTAQVLGELPRHTADANVLLVTVVSSGTLPELPRGTDTIALGSFSMREARAMMGGYDPLPADDSPLEQRLMLPLYLEQLRALGLAVDGVRHTLPPRLADAVSQRVQRLSLSARRVLQAACVLGNRCEREVLFQVAQAEGTQGLDVLKGVGLLVQQDTQVEVVHPFIRDLVEASIPAEARKALHARVLELLSDAPMEVRARHAFGAGEAISALMLLERTGDLAFERGDPTSAVLSYRSGLDLARRELLETGEPALEDAMAGFGRKLGTALAHKGELTGADGVLREALEYSGPASPLRGAILLGLGRVSALRDRSRDAYRLFGEALEVAIQCEDDLTQAGVHRAVGEQRRKEGNLLGAVASFTSALRQLTEVGAPGLELATAAVELASTLAVGADVPAAEDALQRARALAQDAEAPHLEARVAAAEALLCEARGEPEAALEHYRRAGDAAARAGDAPSSRTYLTAVHGSAAL